MKRLILMRHAKSSHAELLQSDFDRPLNDRGRRASREMGEYLQQSGLVPELIFCSPARRTMETLEHLPKALSGPALIQEVPALYHAQPDALAETIQGADDKYMTTLVIGHNPGLQQLALDLAGTRGDTRAAVRRLAEKFPAGAIAVFSLDGESWRTTGPESAHLVDFVTPKDVSD